jgi:hypothetical protein
MVANQHQKRGNNMQYWIDRKDWGLGVSCGYSDVLKHYYIYVQILCFSIRIEFL